MIEIQNNSSITPFGGLHLVHEQIKAVKFSQFINSNLGNRRHNAGYSYSDMFLNMCYIVLCGGDCAQDIDYIKDTLCHLKGMETASPDTLLGMQKELSTEAEIIISDSGTENKINVNDRLNELLVKSSLYLGVLKSDKSDYCMDFDHQFIPTEKHDAKHSYKNKRGYFPAVASINNTPVYIENRNGNCQVKFNQMDTIKRVFGVLWNNGIKPARCRMDCGSYIKDVCDFIEENKVKFFIRAQQSEQLLYEASISKEWKKETIGITTYEVCSIEHTFGKHTHRIVAYRYPNKTGQNDLITNDANNYLFIITNDREETEKSVIEFYNARGNSERMFDIQNNDFNWNKMPFSFLEENTVYLILMAMCNVMYQWLISIFSKMCDFLSKKHRLKKFIFRFICIAGKVIRTGRRQVVKLFTKHDIFTSAVNSS